ncbi:MAG TPA: hypothetical protein P5523_04775, partial [Bacteroidales bacterium]|nr:hypothetical protein [Bacteroidales bacterium]
TRVTSSPLRGLGMFRLTKDASNRQGEGVSYDFTIASADKAQSLNISFEYAVSANFVAGSDTTLGDLNVYIYDVTNSQLIQPTPFKVVGGTGNNHKFTGRFQAASNSTSYRLILHIAGTTASAWTFDFDNVVVGPQVLLMAAAMDDWKAYTPTITGFGTPTSVAVYSRRVGDTLEVHGRFTAGTVDGTDATISLGYAGANGNVTVDTSKISTSKQVLGSAGVDQNSGSVFGWEILYGTTSVVHFGVQSSTTAGINNPVAGSTICGNSNVVSFSFHVPIVGWGSNVLMSQDADTRVCAARFTKTTSQSIPTNTDTLIDYETVDYDTHGAFNLSTDRYTAPLAGYYAIAVSTEYAANGTGQRATQLYKNGSLFCELGAHATVSASFTSRVFGNTTLYLNAGDYLELYGYQSSGGNLNLCVSGDDYTYVSINRITGPALPVAGETVACYAYADSVQTILVDTVFTKINFTNTDFDTHGAFSTANDRYTAPMSGIYELFTQVRLDGGFSANETETAFYKNGVEVLRTNKNVVGGGDGLVMQGMLKLNAGDYVEVFVKSTSGSNRSTSSTTTKDTNFSIKKVA